ncbi:MAG: SPOR domain-containing protein [Gemmatimonadales bacterium]
MSARRAALGLAILLACACAAARAQDNPAIQTAVCLAGEGRSDEARRLVNAELAKARVGEPAYVEALYWRARIAATGDSAERDLRRVAIEYPTSRWAVDALLQLAQLATAAGNPVSAFALAQRLRSDYPDSDLRPRAALWAGRAAFDLGDARGACALLDSARAEGAADVEFTNQVDFYRARCASLPAAPAPGAAPQHPATGAPPRSDTAHAPPPAAPAQRPAAAPVTSAPPAPAAARGGYVIQAAAVRTAAEADRILRKLRGAGLTARVLIGADHLRRVRVGSYGTERAARDALAAVRRVAGGRPFVVREP